MVAGCSNAQFDPLLAQDLLWGFHRRNVFTGWLR
jgi:hypothetical protein